MYIIFLTGTIGSGKSTVSRILKELGAVIIDSDKVAREILNPGTLAYQETVATFGQEILTSQGDIDRQKLARKVFENPVVLEKLNNITHPRVNAKIDSQVQLSRERKTDVLVIEAALVTESNWIKQVNQSWVVKASKEVTLKRLKNRGLSESESLARLANQPPPEDKLTNEVVIINNDGNMEELRAIIEKLWNQIHNEV
jgi:dephospho-CoA kinase